MPSSHPSGPPATAGAGRRRVPAFAVLLAGLAMATVSGCARDTTAVEPGGRLPVLGPTPAFTVRPLPSEWVGRGPIAERVRPAVRGGVPALAVAAGGAPVLMARRTRAVLLATPYLSWAWNMRPARSDPYPLKMIVGFRGGTPEPASFTDRARAWITSPLSLHDRRLLLTWSESALRRGDLSPVHVPGDDEATAWRYTVSGGIENTGQWRLETVDLATLYARAWPGDAVRSVAIVFIGFTVDDGGGGAMISGIVLSR